jgi:hypothetical protein
MFLIISEIYLFLFRTHVKLRRGRPTSMDRPKKEYPTTD